MDLNLIVNNTLSDLKEEGYVEKIVKKQIEETIHTSLKIRYAVGATSARN
ncbi:hypothetical protein P8818_14090 [Bacillus velezensis]|nr:hypothetical protein [Bacillus velezensis]MEC0388694.1 hypothetical protein [Bacillus velezensis]